MRRLVVVLCLAMAVFIALLIAVTSNSTVAIDSRAFEIVGHLRGPWLDHAARLITTLGLFFVVAPVLLVGAVVLIRRRHRARAGALVAGAVFTSITVWITKAAVGRPRPPDPLIHTAGHSFPSGHSANAMGWLALAIALSVVIPSRAVRVTMIACGALLAALIGLSRIYLRAHYLSDVIAGESLATAVYAAASLIALTWLLRHRSQTDDRSPAALRAPRP